MSYQDTPKNPDKKPTKVGNLPIPFIGTLMSPELNQPVAVRENGVVTTITRGELIVKLLVRNACGRDYYARKVIYQFMGSPL